MKKNAFNYIFAIALFLNFTTVAAIGLLLGFVIPKGGPSTAYFLGLHRHQWGDIHLFLAVLFLALLSYHLWSHWTWIAQSSKRYFGDRWKNVLWALLGGWIVVVVVAWIVVKIG